MNNTINTIKYGILEIKKNPKYFTTIDGAELIEDCDGNWYEIGMTLYNKPVVRLLEN